MIKATDLRIGNWFINGDGKYEQVYSVEAEGVNSCADNYDPLDKTYEPAKPIPLTPELLEKCGFKKASYQEDHELESSLYGMKISYESFVFTNPISFWTYEANLSGGVRTRLLYLHQLQNLYFALTGEELTVNIGTTVEAS